MRCHTKMHFVGVLIGSGSGLVIDRTSSSHMTNSPMTGLMTPHLLVGPGEATATLHHIPCMPHHHILHSPKIMLATEQQCLIRKKIELLIIRNNINNNKRPHTPNQPARHATYRQSMWHYVRHTSTLRTPSLT